MTDNDIVLLLKQLNLNKQTFLTKNNIEQIIINPLKQFLDNYTISNTSKCILSFKNYPDFIIKIPLSHNTNIENTFISNTIFYENNLFNFVSRIDDNFLTLFKNYTLLSSQLPYPIYKQEKVQILSTIPETFITQEYREELTLTILENIDFINKNVFSKDDLYQITPILRWYVNIINTYGKNTFNFLLQILGCTSNLLDIHPGNIGYDKNNNPCIIDYSLQH